MGLYDSFEEDISSPSNSLTRVNVEELFDDPKYISSTAIQVCTYLVNWQFYLVILSLYSHASSVCH